MVRFNRLWARSMSLRALVPAKHALPNTYVDRNILSRGCDAAMKSRVFCLQYMTFTVENRTTHSYWHFTGSFYGSRVRGFRVLAVLR